MRDVKCKGLFENPVFIPFIWSHTSKCFLMQKLPQNKNKRNARHFVCLGDTPSLHVFFRSTHEKLCITFRKISYKQLSEDTLENKNSACSTCSWRGEWAWSLSEIKRMWGHDVLLGRTENSTETFIISSSRHLSSRQRLYPHTVAATLRSISAWYSEAVQLVKLRMVTVI